MVVSAYFVPPKQCHGMRCTMVHAAKGTQEQHIEAIRGPSRSLLRPR